MVLDIIIAMVEILWKTDDTFGSRKKQEFFELRMVDLGAYVKRRFLIREIHARWSDDHQQVVWAGYEDDTCPTPEQAQRLFESRRAAITRKGFMYSEMDFSGHSRGTGNHARSAGKNE